MKLSITRFCCMLILQFCLLAVDLLINAFSDYVRSESVVLLMVFVIQDICQVFLLILIFLGFFATYLFQAGLIGVLFQKFKTPILFSFVYLALSVSLHVCTLYLRWNAPLHHIWTDGLVVLYGMQKFAAPFYYYYYKRTALRLSDPRYYEDLNWAQKELSKS